jgi:lipoate-protein ligase A
MVRLIDSGIDRPETTAAIDEALLRSRVKGRCADTIHLYRRRPASVSIGYFQTASEVADLEACRRDGVPVIRRPSAGGAIYTDERQLVYAVVFRPTMPITPGEGLELACGAIARAMRGLGLVGAEHSGVNDVLAGGSKVSGSAQAIRRGVHLVHGTVLVDADLEAMSTYLRPLPKTLEAAESEVPRARVSTLAELMGSAPPMDEVKVVVARELAVALGSDIEPGSLTEWEQGEVELLVTERFTSAEWNLRR